MEILLNPAFHMRLQREFGRVRVDSRGSRLQSVPALYNGRDSFRIVAYGETYNVNCPFCGDDRGRLSFSYYYPDADYLVRCHNDTACMEEQDNRQLLRDRILGIDRPLTPTEHGPEPAQPLGTAPREPPGEIIPISALPERDPARMYLCIRRGFSIATLDHYLVGWCYRSDNQHVRDRIVIPVFYCGRYVGCLARRADDNTPKHMGKYYNQPGMPKSQLLYNYDNAKDNQFVVLVEGAADVWRIGDHAVGIFGSKLSYAQAQLIASTWFGKPVLLLLDADTAGEKGEDDALALLGGMTTSPVVPLRMPRGCDPADMDGDAVRNIIDAQARQAGLVLEWR